MIDFYAQHKSDRFEFIAFHDASVQSFAELDPKMAKLQKEYWQERSLPFPILLDATGKTIRKFGVHAFPTQILIDPAGKLVGQGSLEGFEKRLLGGEAAPAQPSDQATGKR